VLPFKVALQGLKIMLGIAAQHTIIIAKEQILVNLFLHNFGWVCPKRWANLVADCESITAP
jgi:hypothetical protein